MTAVAACQALFSSQSARRVVACSRGLPARPPPRHEEPPPGPTALLQQQPANGRHRSCERQPPTPACSCRRRRSRPLACAALALSPLSSRQTVQQGQSPHLTSTRRGRAAGPRLLRSRARSLSRAHPIGELLRVGACLLRAAQARLTVDNSLRLLLASVDEASTSIIQCIAAAALGQKQAAFIAVQQARACAPRAALRRHKDAARIHAGVAKAAYLGGGASFARRLIICWVCLCCCRDARRSFRRSPRQPRAAKLTCARCWWLSKWRVAPARAALPCSCRDVQQGRRILPRAWQSDHPGAGGWRRRAVLAHFQRSILSIIPCMMLQARLK